MHNTIPQICNRSSIAFNYASRDWSFMIDATLLTDKQTRQPYTLRRFYVSGKKKHLQLGTGGQGGRRQGVSSSWQDSCPGQVMPAQGSRHLQSGQPRESSSKPSGHSMRHVCAAQGALRVQLTRAAAGARVPGTWGDRTLELIHRLEIY